MTLCVWVAPVSSSVFVVIGLFAEFPPSLHVRPTKGSGEAAGTAEGLSRRWPAVRCDKPLRPTNSGDLLSEGFCGNKGATGLCGLWPSLLAGLSVNLRASGM